MRRMPASIGLLLMTAACGGLGTANVPDPTPPTQALAAWQDFPAMRIPRPIVMFDPYPLYSGFTSDSAKIAAFCSKYSLATELSSAAPPSATASWPGGTSVTYAAISPADAYSTIAKSPTEMQSHECNSVPPLQVTAVHLGQARFGTDRGNALMSAWLFTATGSIADIAYPAIVPSAFWVLPKPDPNANVIFGMSAAVSADGRTLDFGFMGGECHDGYKSAVAESPTAVAVAVVAIPKPGHGVCPAVGISHRITVRLASPLGGRVLLGASGGVEAVCPVSAKTC